jgi:hypothetical protein
MVEGVVPCPVLDVPPPWLPPRPGYFLRYYLGGLGGHWGLKRPSCCCAVMLTYAKAFHLPELILKRLEAISLSCMNV